MRKDSSREEKRQDGNGTDPGGIGCWREALLSLLVALAVATLAGGGAGQESEATGQAAPTEDHSPVPQEAAGEPALELSLPFGRSWSWNLMPHLTLDGIKYSHANERGGGVEFDRASLVWAGDVDERFFFRVEPDLIGRDTPRNLYEAWLAWEIAPALRFTAGQMRIALGSELATPVEDFPLAGYGFTSYLDGRTDVALRADGELFSRRLYYDATAAMGSGFGLEGHRREGPQLSMRLVANPWRRVPDSIFAGLFFGGAVAWSPRYDDPIRLVTPLESRVFETPDLDGRDAVWLHGEAGYALGPVRVGGEVVRGRVRDVARPAAGSGGEDMDRLRAWTAYASCMVSGPGPTWERGAWQNPLASLSPEEGWHDAVEVAARYSKADMDPRLLDAGITNPDPSSPEVRTFSLGVNWYFTESLRFSVTWVKTLADQHLGTFGGTTRDSSFLLRAELAF